MFHHCNHPIRFGHFEHLELPRRCIVTWHLLAANSKLVENFEPSSEYSLLCWQQRKIVSEYSQLACEWFLPWQEIRLKSVALVWRHDFWTKVPSIRIRFHIIFIETANFSLRCHLASIRKRSETMIVFIENDNFWRLSPKWKDLKTQWYRFQWKRIVYTTTIWKQNENKMKTIENGMTTYSYILKSSILKRQPSDPKPLVTSQSPEKVSIQTALHQRLQKRK